MHSGSFHRHGSFGAARFGCRLIKAMTLHFHQQATSSQTGVDEPSVNLSLPASRFASSRTLTPCLSVLAHGSGTQATLSGSVQLLAQEGASP